VEYHLARRTRVELGLRPQLVDSAAPRSSPERNRHSIGMAVAEIVNQENLFEAIG
jgi:hypothetical protein